MNLVAYGQNIYPLPLCRIYLHTAGKTEEKAEFEKSTHESALIKAITLVRRKIATFCEFFVVSKNKTRILSRCSSEAER